MKFILASAEINTKEVTPLVGVLIEISICCARMPSGMVTPLVGVWIEIVKELNKEVIPAPSLPSWECGLKSQKQSVLQQRSAVTPLVGVWIEIIVYLK